MEQNVAGFAGPLTVEQFNGGPALVGSAADKIAAHFHRSL